MCEPSKRFVSNSFLFLLTQSFLSSARRAMIVDLALSLNGSQLIASVLPSVSTFFSGLLLLWCSNVLLLQADKDQRAQLYECIRSHIVTLRGCKTGSKVIWLLYVSSPFHFACTHFVEVTEWYRISFSHCRTAFSPPNSERTTAIESLLGHFSTYFNKWISSSSFIQRTISPRSFLVTS